MKVKILHITQSLGGVEIYIRGLIEYIDKTRYELVVVAPPSNDFEMFCQTRQVKYYNNIGRGRESTLWQDLGYIKVFKEIIKDEKPSLVHLHTAKAGFIGRIACRQLKVKSIFTPHAMSYLGFTGMKRLMYFGLEVFAKRFTDKILACSYSEVNRLLYEVGISEENVFVVPNAISPNRIGIRQIEKDPGIFKIGTISRLTYQKNPLLMIEVANEIVNRYPQARFYILGAGLEDHLKDAALKKIREYQLEEKFSILNWATPEESEIFLRGLDIFVLTSIFEGLPLALLEAMSYGVPCVTSKCDGCIDVVQNGMNGFSCMTKEDFVEKIELLILDKGKAEEMGKNGIEYVEKYHNLRDSVTKIGNYYNLAMS